MIFYRNLSGRTFVPGFPKRGMFVAGLLALLAAVTLWSGCGDIYRPVANPTLQPGGDPQTLAIAVVVNNNGGAASTATTMDITGDTNIGNFEVGAGPVHAALFSGGSRAFVANKTGDSVSSYAPTTLGGQVLTLTLPAGSAPVYVIVPTSTHGFVANSGTHSVGVFDIGTNVETGEIGVGLNPVALAATPDGTHLFVANKGSNTVSVISTSDGSTLATITVGTAPVWMAVKNDGSTLYVANQGDGTLSVIDVASNAVVATLPVGASPRMVLWDGRLRRVYVPATGSNTVSVFNADLQIPTLLKTVTVGAGPSSLTALPDGTRFYVSNAGCADAVSMTGCTGNTVSVVDSNSLTVRKTVTVGSTPVWLDTNNASTKVIVANRDSNNVSDIRTIDDTLVANTPSASPNPMFVVVNH